MNKLNIPDIEYSALNMFLSKLDRGISEYQLSKIYKVAREETGCGVYVDFQIQSDGCPTFSPADSEISGVIAKGVDGKDDIEFILFIRNGFIKILEGYSSADEYPSYDGYNFLMYETE